MENLLLENALVLQAAGFVVCFVLLFWFIAKYRAALVQDTDEEYPLEDLTVMTVAKPAYTSRATVLDKDLTAPALEIADIKEQVKELHYHLEEYKLTQEKNNTDYQKQLTRMEQRLSTFEQEYVNKLQPTLLSLIEELENMKVAEATAPADPTAGQDPHTADLPSDPEIR